MRAQLDTFVEKVRATEGQPIKKGQVILELDVKDAAARLAEAKAKLLKAEDDLRSANAGGKIDEQRGSQATWQKLKRDATGYRRTTMCCSGWSRGKRRRRMSSRRTIFP